MFRGSILTAPVLSAGVLVPLLPSRAGTDPAAFLNELSNQLQTVAGNRSPDQRREVFRRLLHDDFDIPGLGRFVLGRFSRMIMTQPQQQEFLTLFESYASRPPPTGSRSMSVVVLSPGSSPVGPRRTA